MDEHIPWIYNNRCFIHNKQALQTVPIMYGIPDSKVHEANMGPIWGRQDPDGHHVGPMNFAIWNKVLYYSMGFRLIVPQIGIK